ncbi:chloramphenicol acetyltransferase [Clostridium sp. MSJ-4]|uniref:Chloramphenicol acetyltransferase n=1 Tax=Clostridium simiarum TaxID=2841506 RepID=A0ABS6F4U2_9CLOT|nr:CatA-like O-acetyltransferase [Clostridium simiarum]MBU5592628.1 chloramphenicol acetyltransferase [Clostridium simiarum]
MNYKKIDLNTWERKDHFEGFMATGTSFSLTTKLDVTQFYQRIKQQEIKFYAAVIHQVTKTINEFECFRVGHNEKQELVVWDRLEPNYTINSQVSENFVSVWTPWQADVHKFQQRYLETVKTYEQSKQMTPQKDLPTNILVVSMLPLVSFDGFNLNINKNDYFLAPIVTGGKIIKENDKLLLPLAFQVHHAICDGYHVGMFIEKLQQNFDHF